MPATEDLARLVYLEARLIDERRFDEWYALYADDAYYWVPLVPGQADGENHTSLMYEDKLLLRIRIERLAGSRTFSEQPATRCHHLLQTPRIESMDEQAGECQLRTAFHYVETRLDRQTLFAGWATHHLVLHEGALRIRLKRIDLVNSDAAFGNISLFM